MRSFAEGGEDAREDRCTQGAYLKCQSNKRNVQGDNMAEPDKMKGDSPQPKTVKVLCCLPSNNPDSFSSNPIAAMNINFPQYEYKM